MELIVRGLSFAYSAAPVIDKLDLTIPAGRPTLLRGASGSGKTTLLKLCAGLLQPRAGEIVLNGERLEGSDEARRRWRRERAAYLDQENSLVMNWSVAENLALINGDLKTQQQALHAAGLELPPSTVAGQMSGGERQRAALARLLLQKGGLALADEPTSHLDDGHTKQAMQALIKTFKNRVLLIVSHDRRVEDYVDSVIAWSAQ
jgi:ABC-type lipoprotein export system ATPase subunit